jgi:hypothetical protein
MLRGSVAEMPTEERRHVLDRSEAALRGDLFERQFGFTNKPFSLFQLYAANLCEDRSTR